MNAREWADRFEQQAGWTRAMRQYLLQTLQLPESPRILEVGCGTAAVLKEFDPKNTRAWGLDLRLDYLHLARKIFPQASYTCGDVAYLPYRKSGFDLCYCHYFLMWVDATQALAEMGRVTRPGGAVLALAEPDYGGRIDTPAELAVLGQQQTLALARQGADPSSGRKLAALFHQAGLADIQVGVIGANWSMTGRAAESVLEWSVLRADLQGTFSPADLDRLEAIDRQAWAAGERILYVPTFYAVGRVN